MFDGIVQVKAPASRQRRIINISTVIWALLMLAAISACQSREIVPTVAHLELNERSPEKITPLKAPATASPVSPGLMMPATNLTTTPIQSPNSPVERKVSTRRAVPATAEATVTATQDQPATAEPPVPCDERLYTANLFTVVTLEHGLSRDFEPDDLVPLADHLPTNVTMGYPTMIRRVIVEPLTRMINDMIDAGLRPQVLSGYRSYAAQAIAWNKWNELYPEHASIISAPPGYSEHQMGTVIDFGSPELPGVVGQPEIQFHTYFYKTSEGQWLKEHAHEYGFTMSYTLEAFETTGFYYEPWHFRYVGEEMAARLREQNLTFTEYQLANEGPPCLP